MIFGELSVLGVESSWGTVLFGGNSVKTQKVHCWSYYCFLSVNSRPMHSEMPRRIHSSEQQIMSDTAAQNQ